MAERDPEDERPSDEERILTEHPREDDHAHGHGSLWALAFGALGVVYGDIGTSPLYAMREAFHFAHLDVNSTNVLGILSLVFWSLLLVISLKYLVFVLEADNDGEGGILALMTLVLPQERASERTWKTLLILALGLFGSALLYGDGMITPAISVLSAVEGLEILSPAFGHWVIPLTIVILLGLFALQSRGTAGVSRIFSPVILAWFGSLGLLGLKWIAVDPSVLAAVSPTHALGFFLHQPAHAFTALGSIFLVVTGGEALYADMGHFGKRPIRLMWFAFVLPALLIHYFGQGALLLTSPEAIHNPFYKMCPPWALSPMILLATAATVIASQAVISGAFSLTNQAVHLGYCPKVKVVHTSAGHAGQIYIPSVNWALMVATILLVVSFKSSSNLSAAYGVAVATTMVITTMLGYLVAVKNWGWPKGLVLLGSLGFLLVDLFFFGANILKFFEGGWVPLVVGVVIFVLMETWREGREILSDRIAHLTSPARDFVEVLKQNPRRIQGTAVYLNRSPDVLPTTLSLSFRHFGAAHHRIVLLTIGTDKTRPRVPLGERVRHEVLGEGLETLVVTYGFMQEPTIKTVLDDARGAGCAVDLDQATFFLGKETLYATEVPGMAIWREQVFVVLARNATPASDHFQLPRSRTVEIGMPIDL